MSLPLIAKYNKKKNVMYCPDCKSYDVMCDGSGHVDLPTGFGFLPNETKFSLCKIRLKGWIGECEHCHKMVLNYTSRRTIKSYPRSINKKLRG